MRKIEQQMNAAIAAGKNWSKANTTVTMDGEVAEVRLHGNLIAKIGEGFIQVFDGGWQTTTTKSRLNAIFAENGCPGEGVFQKAWQWFIRIDQGGGQFVTVDFVNGLRIN